MHVLKIILLWLLIPAAFASTITQPVVTTTCTFNQAPISCGPPAWAYGGITGLGTADGISVNFVAEDWTQLGSQASARISTDFLGSTDGPERSGLATYSIYADGDHGGTGGVSASAMIEGLGRNVLQGGGYQLHGSYVPFTLGTQFEIAAMVFAESRDYSVAGGTAQIELQLFELDGTPVTIASISVPEPSTWVLATIGVGIVLCFKRRWVPIMYPLA